METVWKGGNSGRVRGNGNGKGEKRGWSEEKERGRDRGGKEMEGAPHKQKITTTPLLKTIKMFQFLS